MNNVIYQCIVPQKLIILVQMRLFSKYDHVIKFEFGINLLDIMISLTPHEESKFANSKPYGRIGKYA